MLLTTTWSAHNLMCSRSQSGKKVETTAVPHLAFRPECISLPQCPVPDEFFQMAELSDYETGIGSVRLSVQISKDC